MAYFPVFIEVERQRVLVVGGGQIALRKVEILLTFGAQVTVVALDYCKELLELKLPNLSLVTRSFVDEDIEGMELVVAATNNCELNSHISKLCRKTKILVNVVDVKEECSFVFPAIIKQEDMVVAISTGGKSPAFAADMKQEISKNIPDYYGGLIDKLGDYRDYIKEEITLPEYRKQVYNELISLGKKEKGMLTLEMVTMVIKKYKTDGEV